MEYRNRRENEDHRDALSRRQSNYLYRGGHEQDALEASHMQEAGAVHSRTR